jgi:Zn-dependent alcohol dehydrogenase
MSASGIYRCRSYRRSGGHEGAGVERVGPNVTTVREGDHVVLSYIPACGRCPSCASGHQNLCDEGAELWVGLQRDGTVRHHVRGRDARLMPGDVGRKDQR